jgi:hypothetical protein
MVYDIAGWDISGRLGGQPFFGRGWEEWKELRYDGCEMKGLFPHAPVGLLACLLACLLWLLFAIY